MPESNKTQKKWGKAKHESFQFFKEKNCLRTWQNDHTKAIEVMLLCMVPIIMNKIPKLNILIHQQVYR